MKIIILGTAYPYRGGMADFNERMAKEFIAENNQVQIWTFSLQYPSILFPGKTQYSEGPRPKGLDIIRKANSVNPLNWMIVGKQLKKENADIIIVPFWLPFMSPCLGSIVRFAKSNKTKIVAILHNMIPHEHRIGDKLFAKYFVNSVDGFVALSQSVLDDTYLFDDKKPRIFCRHPLYDTFGKSMTRDEALDHLSLPKDKRYMLFFGLIRDYKGLDLMMRAYADSRFREMNVKLIVAGEFYSGQEKYSQLEKELNLECLIIWKSGFVPTDEVKYYFCSSDIIVQPYKSATQSGVTQIAYHFEKPMLVTNVGGLAEIVPDGKAGYVVNPDSSEIADALVDFFDNGRQNQFFKGIKEEKKKYAWSNMTSSIRKVAE